MDLQRLFQEEENDNIDDDENEEENDWMDDEGSESNGEEESESNGVEESESNCEEESEINYEEESDNYEEESESNDEEESESNNEEENEINDENKQPITWSEHRRKWHLPEQRQSVLHGVKQLRNRNREGIQEEVTTKKAAVPMLETPKALVTSQTTMKIHDIQSSLQSALEALKYYKKRDGQFDHMEADCVRVLEEREQLKKINKKLADDLQKSKQEVQSYKQKFEQKSIQMVQLQARFSALKQDWKCAKEDNCRIYKEKEKMTKDLEYSRLQVEYYKRIDNLKGALESVAEFQGLRQLMQPKNNSDPESSKAQMGEGPEVSTKRRYVLKVHEVDDSLNCPICFEPWSEYAEHSICSLACGHFFGRSCITRWINNTGSGSSKCPQCLRRATLKDIRNHYVPETFVGDEKI